MLVVASGLPTVLASAVAVVFESIDELLLELVTEVLEGAGCSVAFESTDTGVAGAG